MHITDITGGVTLSNGIKMPYLGLGVWRSENGKEVINAVTYALDAGYRLIDTASIYLNEEGVGKAIANHSLPREKIFLTSKVWNNDQGYDQTIRAFNISLKKLGLSYLDLYLVHWPVKSRYKETWRALETLYNEGKVRSIGISNFLQHHLEDLLGSVKIKPMVNQFEFHPELVQQDLLDFCLKNGIQPESWSPLIKGKVFDLPLFKELSSTYDKTPAQLVLRWNLQKGVIPIPKSVKLDRIVANASIFDFDLSTDDMKRIDALDSNTRCGQHPDHFSF